MIVGDEVYVYRKIGETVEVCDRGAKHTVPWYEVKQLTVIEVRTELVKALNYVTDGYGEVLYAADAQGRCYRKAPHWDGPRATLWVRDPCHQCGDRLGGFDQYPRRGFARDAYGRVLKGLS